MNEIIENLYQRIGSEALKHAEGREGRLLVYAEVEEGVASADLFYTGGSAGTVRFRFCSPSILSLVQELWAQWKLVPGNREWRVLAYVIDGDDFVIDFSYPDQIDENQDVSERRPLAVRKYFGNCKVDYSRP